MDELDDLLDPGVKQENNNFGQGTPLPNANATLALGIISIVVCFLYGIPGLICGIIALSLHQKDKRIHSTDPARYAESFKNAKAGYICAIIGTSLSGLYMIILIIAVFTATRMMF